MTDIRAADNGELFLTTLVRNPLTTLDSVLRTSAAVLPAFVDALRSLPRLATALEQLIPALHTAHHALDRIDRLGMFVAQELPETQHQLEELRKQMADNGSRVAELGPQLVAVVGASRALGESVRLLTRGLGLVQSTTDALGNIIDRLPDVGGPPRPARTKKGGRTGQDSSGQPRPRSVSPSPPRTG